MSSAFELLRKGWRQLTFNNVYRIVDAALRGIGFAYVPKDLVEGQVCAEQLCWGLKTGIRRSSDTTFITRVAVNRRGRSNL